MTNPIFNCDSMDGLLADYIEGTLDAAHATAARAHLAECVRCSGLVRDIEGITAAAAALPVLEPARDLWSGIEERIRPTVVSLSPGRAPLWSRGWVPAMSAAAGLVIATAGVTYLATTRSIPRQPEAVAVASVDGRADALAERNPGLVSAGVVSPVDRGEPAAVAVSGGAPVSGGGRSAPAALASRQTGAALQAEIAYGPEIERLQSVITQRKHELDPATVAIVEENLRVIDAAVRMSRAALAKDPRSGFLADQLNHALDKKVELMRTVALLPSST